MTLTVIMTAVVVVASSAATAPMMVLFVGIIVIGVRRCNRRKRRVVYGFSCVNLDRTRAHIGRHERQSGREKRVWGSRGAPPGRRKVRMTVITVMGMAMVIV